MAAMSADPKVPLPPDALKIILANAGCYGCEDGGETPWRPGSTARHELWHGYGEEVGECESVLVGALVEAGYILPKILPQCAKGHEWYGDGCPECNPEEAYRG